MAKGINIPIAADVGKFIKGAGDVEDALEQVADALDDVSAEGKKTGDDLGKNLSDGSDKAAKATGDLKDDAKKNLADVGDEAKDAGKGIDKELTDGSKKAAKAADDLKDDYKKNLTDVGDEAKDAGKSIDKELSDGTKAAEDGSDKLEKKFRADFEAVRKKGSEASKDVSRDWKKSTDESSLASEEFANETRQNLSATVSSFRGDAEDLVQLVQDIFGGVVGGLGPMGMAAGAAMAAGIGIGVAMLQKSAEEAEAARERVQSLAQEIVDAGGDISKVDVAGKIREWGYAADDVKSWFEPWQERTIDNFDRAAELAEKTGIAFKDVAAGLAGGDIDTGKANLEEIERLIEAETEALNILDEQMKITHGTEWDALKEQASARRNNIDVLEDFKAEQEKVNGETERAIELAGYEEKAIEDTVTALEAKIDTLAELRGDVVSAMEAEEDYHEAVAETTGILEENEATLDAKSEAGRNNRKAVRDQTDAINDLVESMINEGAGADEVRTAQNKMRDSLVKTMTQHGHSEDAAREYVDQLLRTPDEISTAVELDKANAERTINEFVNRHRTIKVGVSTPALGATTARNSGGQIPGANSGRYITGPGSDIEDRVLTALSPGEFVLDKQTTDRVGPGNLAALNEGIGMNHGKAQGQPVNVEARINPADIEALAQALASAVEGATGRGFGSLSSLLTLEASRA